MDPDNPIYYFNLGTILAEFERYDESESEFRKSIKLNPHSPSTHNNLSGVLFQLKRYDEAEFEIKEALRLDPNEIICLNNYGTLLTKFEHYDEAFQHYRKAIKLYKYDVGFYQNLSELYIILNKPSRSIKFARDSLKYSKKTKDYVISRFLIFISKMLLGKKQNKNPFIAYLKQNEGYKLRFEFDTLKKAFKNSRYEKDIELLITEIKKYSKKENILSLKQEGNTSD